MNLKSLVKPVAVIVLLVLAACNNGSNTPEVTAQNVVDRAIENAGGDAYLNSSMQFDFRDLSYKNSYKGGTYSLERSREDTTGLTIDIIDNKGFRRLKNGKFEVVADSMAVKYTNSVNSVHYFARLPFGLNDAAVKKTLLGTDTINDQPYFEVEVRFAQEGGGVDFQDIFVYWFHAERYSLDYLAYSYETDGGGVRFRKAINQRKVSGISFADYINYKPSNTEVVLSELDDMLESGALAEVSRIELKNIQVTLNQP
ncbi:MAG: DUF6503 family protein [Gilvibacter sp.]